MFTNHPRVPAYLSFVVALILTAAACSGDRDDGSTASSALTSTSTSTSIGTSIPDDAATSSMPSLPGDRDRPSPGRRSDGCGASRPDLPAPDQTGDAELEIDIGGQKRKYRLGVPAPSDPTEPHGLILNLHGSGSNAIQQSVYSQLAIHGPDRGYVVVTPDAIGGQWELVGEGDDDEFLMTLIDHVASEHCVDTGRIHAAGISLGAWKASITACEHPDVIASILLVAEEVAPEDCAMPVVAMHGTADSIVPYGNDADDGVEVTGSNAGLPGVEVNMPNWARQAGCSTDKDVERIEPDVDHWVYQDCPDGYDVELYSIVGGGHTWPGSPIDLGYLGATTTTIDATQIALDWFDEHPLPR